MIKKLLASFLLTTFVTNIVYAEKTQQSNIPQEDFTVEASVKTETKAVVQPLISEEIVFPTNIKTKITTQDKEENNMIEEQVNPELNQYIEKNKQYIESTVKTLDKLKINSLLASQNNGVVLSFDIEMDEIKGRIELPWYNGNYIVWNTGMAKDYYYAAEFDSRKDMTGFVALKYKNKTYICHEFLGWDDFDVPLTTTFIYYKDSNAAFLLDSDGEIIMYKIKDDIQVLKPNKVKNPDFIKDITNIFDNPKAAVKTGVKYSVKTEPVAEIKKIDDENYVNLNYKATTFNMDLYQAVRDYYGVPAENEPLILRAYNLQQKNGVEDDKMSLSSAPKSPESYFIALEKGIIPKYFPSTYFVCNNEVIMDLIVATYDLMVKNNFSENDIKNFMYFYSDRYFKDAEAISISDIESIINNKSISQEDKIYYIYAKMDAKHHNNPNIETDIINSIKLLKQNPKIVKKGIYPTSLNDEFLVILNFDTTRCCKTEEVIKKVLDIKNISDEEKFFRILGEIKKETLKKEKENYPEILYQIAETGILSRYFHDNDAIEYYKNEKILQDVLSASKLLIQNKFWKWAKDYEGDIFTIAPELCVTTKIVQDVLNDKKILMKDKEEIIARRLYKEKYLAYNENQIKNGWNYDIVSDDGFLLIEKGYVPKFINEYELKYNSTKVYNELIDLLKNKGLNDTQIKTITESISRCPEEDWIKSISEINDPNQILKQLILKDKSFYSGSEDSIKKLFEIGLINIDNIQPQKIQYWDFKKIKDEDIAILVKLKNTEGFKDSDIQRYIYNDSQYIPYLSKALEIVLKDSIIKVEDRSIFTYALAKREYKKAEYPKVTESYIEAIDNGIVPYYEFDDNYCKGILEIYKYMNDDLGYTGKQINTIIKYTSNYPNSDYNVSIDKAIKVVKDEKYDYDQKNAILSKSQKQAEKNIETKAFLKKLPMKILAIVTFPIWIIPAMIFSWSIKDI